MDEYIKREAYYQQIDNLSKGKHGVYCAAINDCMNVLDEQPAADVVEVVRCKDCEYYRKNKYSPDEDMWCMCWCDWLPTDPDDFCSYGEKK